jgi:anti-sigma factor RsiW
MRKTMNCKEAQKRVSAYLDGELQPQQSRLLTEHLATCAACCRVKVQLQSAYSRLAEEEPLPADPFMVTRVRAALTNSAGAGKKRLQSTYRLLLPVSVAAGLLLGLVLGQQLSANWPAESASIVAAESLEASLINQVPASTLTTSYLDLSWLEGVANE